MFVHISRIQKQYEYLLKLGIDINPLILQTGIPNDVIANQDRTVDFDLYKMVLDFAIRQTGNPSYGLAFGDRPQLGGTLGMMSASCATLKEALIQGCKFLGVQGDFATLSFFDHNESPALEYSLVQSWALHSPHTSRVEVDAMFAFLNRILKENSNNIFSVSGLSLTFDASDDADVYCSMFGVQPKFNAEKNALFFSREAMNIPMKAFNPETATLLQNYLQSQLNKYQQGEGFAEKVRRILYSSFQYQFPDIESVAEKLNLSPRTLQRKLSEEDQTFKRILQDTRFGIAKELLKQNMLTISEISYLLGYSDLGNFSRSFKKFQGVSPQEFRVSSG